MRKLVLVTALLLGGCAINPFTVVTNPINNSVMYEAELAFDASLKTFNQLKALCSARVLPSTCRTYVVKGQGYIRQAYAADMAARQFVAQNPTLDATNVVQAFTGVVSNFKATVDSLSAIK